MSEIRKKNMSCRQGSFLLTGVLIFSSMSLHAAKVKSLSSEKKDSVVANVSNVNGKEVKGRNVMLGAGDSSTPRTLNIGLPFSGDILINENDLPVVYTFWTQIPTTCWRYDSSLGAMGVMSFSEGALQYGKVGYTVTSSDREPGRKFRGYGGVNFSSEGNAAYDLNISTPIGKGWGISLSASEIYNHGSFDNLQFANWQDRYESFKAGVYKKYERGQVGLLYKYAMARPITGSYTPYRYLGNGKTEGFNGFDPGRDSYIVGNGFFPYIDFYTGKERLAKMGADSVSRNVSHAFYLYGNHRFGEDYKLKWSMMYMHSEVALTMQYPISMNIYDKADDAFGGAKLYLPSSVVPYEGAVQMIASQYYPQVGINQFMSKGELTKSFGQHNMRLGLTYMYYNAPILQQTGTYVQTVENNPRLLSFLPAYPGVTQTFCLGGTGSYSRAFTSKTALYLADDFRLNQIISGGVGARLEMQTGKNHAFPYPNKNYSDFAAMKAAHPDAIEDFVHKTSGKINYVLTGNILAQLTKPFGLMAEATYNRYYSPYTDYAEKNAFGAPKDANYPLRNKLFSHFESVMYAGGGIYFNLGQYINLVSKLTYINKHNIVTSENLYTALGQYNIYPITYDIKTLGWTTDVMSSIGNFNMHALLTLQNPKYKNYAYSTPDGSASYSYDDKIIPTLSKVIIELDPSYYLCNRDVRIWASARYFGKQYGNKTNTISYKGWWETFLGVDWKVNRYLSLKGQVRNLLNQKGVQGSLVGGEQITNESQMIGKGFVAEQIRPRCVEVSASFNF